TQGRVEQRRSLSLKSLHSLNHCFLGSLQLRYNYLLRLVREDAYWALERCMYIASTFAFTTSYPATIVLYESLYIKEDIIFPMPACGFLVGVQFPFYSYCHLK
ncbi:unnamed protein product, partial [Ixodes persulcatus]